jgi:circadian clock protein KaiB
MTTRGERELKRSEDVLAAHEAPSYELTLFVSGASELSARAIDNAKTLFDLHLGRRYHLAVVDVHQDLGAVIGSDVIAAPTLVKNRPLPVRKLVGDLSDTHKVLLALCLPVAEDAPTALG